MNIKIITKIYFILFCFLFSRAQVTKECNLNIEKLNDSICAIGAYKNNLKTGQWIYFKNEKIIKSVMYKNDSLNGVGYYYNTSGLIIREAMLKRNKLNGLVKFYSNSGVLLAVFEFKNDIKTRVKYYKSDIESPPKSHFYRPEY